MSDDERAALLRRDKEFSGGHGAAHEAVGGFLSNSPDNMIRWLQNPRAIDPLTTMPNLGLAEQGARDIAGDLYTLR